MYSITLIDRSEVSGYRIPSLKSMKIAEEIKFASFRNETNRSNVILKTGIQDKNEEENEKGSSFLTKVIHPNCVVIENNDDNTLLDNTRLTNGGEMLLVDILRNKSDGNDNIEVDCVDGSWQPEKVKIDKFIFHDLDTETTIIKDITIDGSSDSIIGLEKHLEPTKNLDQLNNLIEIFKENNERLHRRLLNDTDH